MACDVAITQLTSKTTSSCLYPGWIWEDRGAQRGPERWIIFDLLFKRSLFQKDAFDVAKYEILATAEHR